MEKSYPEENDNNINQNFFLLILLSFSCGYDSSILKRVFCNKFCTYEYDYEYE